MAYGENGYWCCSSCGKTNAYSSGGCYSCGETVTFVSYGRQYKLELDINQQARIDSINHKHENQW